MRICALIAISAGVPGVLATHSVLASGPVESVSEMPGAIVLDIAQANVGDPLGPFVFGSEPAAIVATAISRDIGTGTIQDPPGPGFFNRGSTCGAIPAWCGSTDPAVNPGDFMGRFDTNKDLIITFDTPVAGAGMSFYSNGNGGTMSTGSIITAYDGPQGTGSVIGSATSPDTQEECCPFTTPAPWYFIYFRGVTSNEGNIRSIVISPTVASNGWGVDAIAVAPAGSTPGCNAADITGDGILNNADINAFVSAFLASDPLADINNDGSFNNTDVNEFVSEFLAGCGG